MKTIFISIILLLICFNCYCQPTKSSVDYYLNGLDKLGLKDYIGAIAEFNKAIEIEPQKAFYYILRGWAKDGLQDYRGAITDYDKAIEIKPNNDDTYNSRGLSKAKLHDNKGAFADFKIALEINPKNCLSYFNRGLLEYDLQYYYTSIEDFDMAIEICPKEFNLSSMYYTRGLAKLKIGQKDSGCLDFSKAGELGMVEAYDTIKELCN